MTEPDGSISWYNQRWFDHTGTTMDEMAGWGWKSVHHPDHIERVERLLCESFRTGENREDTFPLRSRDRTYNWFLSRARPIRDVSDEAHPKGRVVGWFGSNTEIRETGESLAFARDDAEAANRAKSTLIANTSHELRTPLSAAVGYAEMLSEEIEDGTEPGDRMRGIQKIEGNARNLLGLINDVPVAVLTALDLNAEDRLRLRGANQALNKGDTSLLELAERLSQPGKRNNE